MSLPSTTASAHPVRARALSRSAGDARAAAPVRMVHLGLGNFFRAHQAWYTDRAPDATDWGFAAFTGRSARLADALSAQDCLYTLCIKDDTTRYDVVGSISRAHSATEHEAWLGYLRSPELAVVTVTVSEAGYALSSLDGALDVTHGGVRDDLERLREDPTALVRTVPGRLVAGLLARRAAGAGPLAVVPCDNLAHNGSCAERAVTGMADLIDPTVTPWITANVSWVTTMVDRITPATTAQDVAVVQTATGRIDATPVVTEPFSEWVLAGHFPAGRPRWEEAGAQVVEDITPFENRKLWLLNGAHSLLAYAGSTRGHQTVAEAIADPVVSRWVDTWWNEALPHLALSPVAVNDYCEALRRRFASPHIRHLLAQIAADGSKKLPLRILPIVRAERAAGRLPVGAARVLAGWVCHLRGVGTPIQDPAVVPLLPAARGPLDDATRSVIAFLDIGLGTDDELVRVATILAREMGAS